MTIVRNALAADEYRYDLDGNPIRKNNLAAYFNGVDTYLGFTSKRGMPLNTLIYPTGFSVHMRLKIPSDVAGNATLFSASRAASTKANYIVKINNTNHAKIEFLMQNNNSTMKNAVTTNEVLVFDEYIDFLWTDSTYSSGYGHNPSIHINGSKVTGTEFAGSAADPVTIDQFHIGGFLGGGSLSLPMEMWLREVRIHQKALSTAQALALHNGDNVEDSLLCRIICDGNVVDTARGKRIHGVEGGTFTYVDYDG